MNLDERLELFRTNLLALLNSEKMGYVIFDSGGKFVQFANEQGSVWIDIPKEEMSEEEENRLLALKVFSNDIGRKDPKSGNLVAYEAKYEKAELEKAVLFTERIFIEVFKLEPKYDFKVTLRFESNVDSLNEFDLNYMDGHQFEALIEDLVRRMGLTVDERKLTADGGVDILAHSHEPLFEGKYVIQCKRYTQKVPEPPVRDLYGVVHSRNANKGILITNSTFTQAAIDFAKDKQLELIDGTALWSLLSKYDILKNQKGVTLANKTSYLLYSFLPLMKKLKKSYEDIQIGKEYLEKKPMNEKEWKSLFIETSKTSVGFFEWYHKYWQQFLIPLLKENPLNIQRLKETNEQLFQGTQRFIRTYKTFVETSPPTRFSLAYDRYLKYFDELFKSIFEIVNELESLAGLPLEELKSRALRDNEKGVISLNLTARFPKDFWDAAVKAFKES
jgi:HJR/Mrr/RecB family endonuclease